MNLVWLDIETTGLVPGFDNILELGIVVTDPNLKVLSAKSWVLGLKNFEERIEKVDAIVYDMHKDNGLWLEVRDSKLTPKEVEAEAIAFLREQGCIDVQTNRGKYFPPMCGSSVHFDRGFLKQEMPALESQFSHRHLDASSLLLACDVANKPRPKKPPVVGHTHRAISDCLDSIGTLRGCLAALES